jgi:hypothetical protein
MGAVGETLTGAPGFGLVVCAFIVQPQVFPVHDIGWAHLLAIPEQSFLVPSQVQLTPSQEKLVPAGEPLPTGAA